MRQLFAAAAAIATILAAGTPAVADDASGRWHVAGHIAGKDFTLDCRFTQGGAGLTGACVDGPTGDKNIKGGRSHPVIKSQVAGEKVSFTYETNKAFFYFKVDYVGVRKGDHMTGQINAVGNTGNFTADRTGS